MLHQRLIAARQVLLGLRVQITARGGQAVTAMLLGNAAERPQCILQSLCQGHEAFAAEDDMAMLETGKDQAEVIEAMLERFAGDRHA